MSNRVPLIEMIDLPVHLDERGRLTAIEGAQDVPSAIRRVYYLYDVPAGETRAGHAHWGLEQLIVALSGSFTVTLDDGRRRDEVILNHPYTGLLVRRMVWREIADFSSGAVCLVLASEHFDEADYIRDYSDFRAAARDGRT